jgi:hypothetical protein
MGRPDAHREAVHALADRLDDVPWALTGSTSFALQEVPVEPDDVDVQTTAAGAHEIAERFREALVDPVTHSTGDGVRSQFGRLRVAGVEVEVMGGPKKRRPGGGWEEPVDVTEHRRFVTLDGRRVPVLSPSYEARAYERLGREQRAALLRSHAADD